MIFRNTTDLPDVWIRSVVRALRPPRGMWELRVHNNAYSQPHRGGGTAYVNGTHYVDHPLVVVRVARTDADARDLGDWREGAYLQYATGSRREVLVAILAHEIRHLRQASNPRLHKVWGSAKGQFSERDADAAGLRALRAYRRGDLTDPRSGGSVRP